MQRIIAYGEQKRQQQAGHDRRSEQRGHRNLSTGPITTSMIDGGIRMPSVPPAAIRPDDSFTS